jgi:type I restriction enzyme S subunit
VILSIKPRFVEAILNGSKSHEFRRTIFDGERVGKAYIYSTSPVKHIVASFRIGEIVKDRPEALWSRFGSRSGLEMEEFFSYYDGREQGYAIGIVGLERFVDPIDPSELLPGFRPPQSFCYVDDRELGLHGPKNPEMT